MLLAYCSPRRAFCRPMCTTVACIIIIWTIATRLRQQKTSRIVELELEVESRRELEDNPKYHFRNSTGREFKIDNYSYLYQLETVRRRSVTLTLDNVDDFVFLHASDAGHFVESTGAIESIQRFFPRHKVIYYDLGLDPEQAAEVGSWCGVEYRKFRYKFYPGHVRHHYTYAFKAVAILETLLAHSAVFWLDASVRFTSSNLSTLTEVLLRTGGISAFSWIDEFGVYQTTHPSMYLYLPTDVNALRTIGSYEATAFFIVNTKPVYENIIYWFIQCSLERDCISPSGARLKNPKRPSRDSKEWWELHRYDQSSLGILLYNYSVLRGQLYSSLHPRPSLLGIHRMDLSQHIVKQCAQTRTLSDDDNKE